jgi:hypothetical protein
MTTATTWEQVQGRTEANPIAVLQGCNLPVEGKFV